ncbi:hypothetical protein ASPVEDRAFT_683894 [Aspergillus versicolor CBS 583.65]|uniref:Uncharacterized protein n=1 Tax=Aspergillus versicolor CBS 583.65 TaxID=1036611 RepID=A0A1L9PM64_ASPVE|nr:uncharacterized protein ASPVEDRAFT_683894 [Aspergillus versicolor CBS 583.65]OJJ02583.1 hypothetical protein ASPVEDRAFT_683894 [Aspergillus versicolor CBS 583.65]
MILFYSIPIPSPDLLEYSMLLRNSEGSENNNAIDGACVYGVGFGPARRYLDTRLGNGGRPRRGNGNGKNCFERIIPSNEPRVLFFLPLIIYHLCHRCGGGLYSYGTTSFALSVLNDSRFMGVLKHSRSILDQVRLGHVGWIVYQLYKATCTSARPFPITTEVAG